MSTSAGVSRRPKPLLQVKPDLREGRSSKNCSSLTAEIDKVLLMCGRVFSLLSTMPRPNPSHSQTQQFQPSTFSWFYSLWRTPVRYCTKSHHSNVCSSNRSPPVSFEAVWRKEEAVPPINTLSQMCAAQKTQLHPWLWFVKRSRTCPSMKLSASERIISLWNGFPLLSRRD